MKFPSELKYSKEHIWIKTDDDIGTIGITEFAESELGEIVFVDLPTIGKSFAKDEVFGSVEAIKTVSDLFMPVSGEVIDFNDKIKEQPTLVNEEPFNGGWILKIKISNLDELNSLLSAEQYKEIAGS